MAAEEVKQEAAAAPTQETAKTKFERPTNCQSCNKPIKKIKRFYRNSKFYCSRKCWEKNVRDKEKTKNDKK